MSKHGDYKTADAPKAEPLKTGLSDFIKPDFWKRLAEQISPASNDTKVIADDHEKEQTP